MKERTKPCISFMLALIFLISSIPIPAIESQADGTGMEYVTSGNTIDEKEVITSSSQAEESVSGNEGVTLPEYPEEADETVSYNITVFCNDPTMGSIQVRSDGKLVEPVGSQYPVEEGKQVEILAIPEEYYKVASDSAGLMNLKDNEKGTYEWVIPEFHSDCEKEYRINFEEIDKVNILRVGNSVEISRQMHGGKITVSENGIGNCVQIVPDYGYYFTFNEDHLLHLSGDLYQVNRSTSIIFREDEESPVITISGNFIHDRFYTNGKQGLYAKVEDNDEVKVDMNLKVEMEELGKNLYKFIFRGPNFNAGEQEKEFTITARDKSGNVSENTITVVYDEEAPKVLTVSINSIDDGFQQNDKYYFNADTIKMNVDVEENVGLSHLNQAIFTSKQHETSDSDFIINKVYSGEEIPIEFENCSERTQEASVSIKDLASGTYYIYFAATDLAENRQEGELPYGEIHIDRTPPEIKVLTEQKWYKGSDTITVDMDISDECTADGLQYKYKIVRLNNTIASNDIGRQMNAETLKPESDWIKRDTPGDGSKDYSTSISVNEVLENGSYALLIWAKDGCGNESAPVSYVFHYDEEPASIDDIIFEVTEGEEKNFDKFIRRFGNFFRQNTVEGKKQEVRVKAKAHDEEKDCTYYCKDIEPEIEDVHVYYIEEDEKDKAEEYANNEASQDELPKFGSMTKLIRENSNEENSYSDTYGAALAVPKKSVFYQVMVVARDKAGNIHCAFPHEDKYKKYQSSLVMVDQKKPDIQMIINKEFEEPDYIETTNSGKKEWYNGNRPISYTVVSKDLDSGLFDLQVSLNKETVIEENFAGKFDIEMVNDYEKTVGLSKDAIGTDGKCVFYAKSYDNAGNMGETETKAIYVDKDKPIITNITFSAGGSDDMNTLPKQYGFFFKKKTTVKISATDFVGNSKNPGSGIKSFTYYMESSNGKKTKAVDLPVKSGKNGIYTASFNVPAGFKGQIYVKAIDNTNQSSDYTNPKGIIIESAKEHKNCSYANIIIKDTPYKDANGNPLYNKMPVIRFETGDDKSGIAKNVWKVKAANDKEPEKKGELIVRSTYDKKKGSFHSSLESDTNWNIPEKLDLNLVTKANKSYRVVSEKNSIEASLKLTDNAGNHENATKKVFSVDVTAPKVFVEYDNNEAYNGKFYNKERYATIHVIDANFSEEGCEIKTTGPGVNKSEWEHISGSGCNGKIHSKDCEYICRVGFVTDGDYTFGFECTDLAGWSSSYGQLDEFTIDMTEPVIQVSYDNQNAQNGNYYKDARIATIQIEEHNFSPEGVSITMTATDGGNAIAVPEVRGWTQNEDFYTATIAYDYDGEFTFDIEYTDLAENQASEYEQDQFIIDITQPEIEITGIIDRSANKGKVQPVITCNDTNLEDAVILLKGANRGNVKVDYETSRAGTSIVYKVKDLEHIKKNDDIYLLHVTARDKAGNEYEEEIHYSVNRFGSVYQYDKQTEGLINDYYASKCDDLVIKEVNVNSLKVKRVTYSKDGEIVTLQEGKNYRLSQSGDEFNWKEYEYTIFKENFDEEGMYILTLYSEDQANNQSDNKAKGKDIEFVIDKTAPSLVLSGIRNGGQYNEDSKELIMNAEDNIGIASLEVYNDGQRIASFDGETITEAYGTLSVSLQSKNDWQNLVVVTRDMAGNESRSEALSYLLTTNLFVQWYKNPWIFYGSIAVIILLAGITYYLIRLKESQKKK
ncbi:MAG: hypothetical protein HDR22_03110 [Lachnospiraceae bacterium]|nr:hypothetical protein [Lachnospiraceae bacterium]